MKTPKKPLVIVLWRDAHSTIADRPRGDCTLVTVGWLLKAGRKWTVVANEHMRRTRWTDAGYRGFTRIPTPNVLETMPLNRDTEAARKEERP